MSIVNDYIKKSKRYRSTEGELVENKKNENEEQNFQNVDDMVQKVQAGRLLPTNASLIELLTLTLPISKIGLVRQIV
ncbi:hypothetical protein [Orientia tsutsugamushi]|uniref:hypothetical protein n=1 Tax=Orientia tsutsugamushi TaxID=784 RepID=UPI00352746C2